MVQTQVKEVDIVIPLGPSEIDHEDLRFCLRGIEKYVTNYRDIWIVGDLPSWIQGVGDIPHSDEWHPKWKEKNIWNKMMAACLNSKITPVFAMFNDDHVIIQKTDISKYPFYFKGTCEEAVKNNKSVYKKTMHHTRNLLLRRHFRDRNFDTHTPILYDKSKFLTTFEPEHWLTPYGYGIKSLYCGFNKIEGVYMPDCKIRKSKTREQFQETIKDRHVISFNDAGFKGIKPYLQEIFTEKSSYEK